MVHFERLFSINGIDIYPPSNYQEDPVPVVGYNALGEPIRQGYQVFTFLWDVMNQEQFTALWNMYTPSTPAKSVVFIAKETGLKALMTGMMHEPIVGTRQTVYHLNVAVKFTHCISNVGYSPGDDIPIDPNFFTLALKHLADVDDSLAPTTNQVLKYNGSFWYAGTDLGATVDLIVKKGGVALASTVDTIDFNNGSFDVALSGTKIAGVGLHFGTASGQPLEGLHAAITTGIHGVGAGAIVGTTLSQVLTNKTLTAPIINAATLTGTIAGGTFTGSTLTSPTINAATLTGTIAGGTFTGSTLTTPTISGTGFVNANHAHLGSTSGGQLTVASLSDFTTSGDGRWVSLTGSTMTGALEIDGGLSDPLGFIHSGNDTIGSRIQFSKTRNALVSGHTIVVNGDALMTFSARGSDGVQFFAGASIIASVDGAPGLNSMPGRLTFNTTVSGASTTTERMRITNAGDVGIGKTPTTGVNLDVNGEIRAGTAGTNAASVVTVGGTQTLTAKTLTTPTISSTGFTNANHVHLAANSGGQLTVAALSDFNSAGDTRWVNTTGDAMTGALSITNASGAALRLISTDTGGTSPFLMDQHSADAISSRVYGRKSRNATAGSHTIVQSGDAFLDLFGQGSNGTSFDNGALIRLGSDGTPGASADMPGKIEFWTTPDASATLSLRGTIKNDGTWVLNNLVGTSSRLVTASSTGVLGASSSPVLAGDVPVWDGSTWITRPQGQLLRAVRVELIDDFDAGANSAGNIGRKGWTLSGLGVSAFQVSVANHPGIYRLLTQAVNGQSALLSPSTATFINDWDEVECIFNPASGTVAGAVQYGVFLTDTTNVNNNCVGLLFQDSISANWQAIKQVATVQTLTNTGVVANGTAWVRVLLKRTGSGAFDVTVEQNGSSATVNMSGLTLGNVFPCIRLITTAAVAKAMDIDYYREVTLTASARI